MSSNNSLRIFIAVIGFIGAVTLPFWVPLLCAIVLSVRWRAWEVLLLGLFMDFLWMPGSSLFGIVPLCTLCAVVIVWAFEPIRREFLAS